MAFNLHTPEEKESLYSLLSYLERAKLSLMVQVRLIDKRVDETLNKIRDFDEEKEIPPSHNED